MELEQQREIQMELPQRHRKLQMKHPHRIMLEVKLTEMKLLTEVEQQKLHRQNNLYAGKIS